jgi:hypothetical protein
MSTTPSAVQASPKDFVQYGLDQVQQFVSVPSVEHILVEQPVTFKQYKQKTTYVQVPVPQKYSKLIMNHQNQQQQQAPQVAVRDYIPTVAGVDKPVYGCGAGPFQQRAWGEDEVIIGDQGDVSNGEPFRAFRARAPMLREYIPTVAGLDKPVYGDQAGPFQQRAWGGFAPNQGLMENDEVAVFSPNNYFYSGMAAPPSAMAAMAARNNIPRVNSYAGLY